MTLVAVLTLGLIGKSKAKKSATAEPTPSPFCEMHDMPLNSGGRRVG